MNKKINRLFTIMFTLLLLFTSVSKVSAASASIHVSSSTNRIVVGKTFTVNVKVSSSNTIGTWEWTMSYDTKKLKWSLSKSARERLLSNLFNPCRFSASCA